MATNIATGKRAAICAALTLVVGTVSYIASLHHESWHQARWQHDRLHSSVEALGAIAAVGLALVLTDRRRNRSVRFTLVASFLGMGIFDLFHAICSHADGFVVLHVASCQVGSIGFLLAWLPQPDFRGRYWILWLVAAACTICGVLLLINAESLPPVFHDNESFVWGVKAISILAGSFFLIGSGKFFLDFVRTGDWDCFLFLSLGLMFSSSDFAFAASGIWLGEWWSWHVTRFLAFSLAFGVVVRGYVLNAAGMRTSLLEQKKVERLLRRRTRDLKERVKELTCLYRFYELLEQPENDLASIFQGVVDILCPSFRYTEITCARIVYEESTYRTLNFRETRWKLSSPLKCCQEEVGRIEVYYLEEDIVLQENVFLDEERQLLEAISEHLSATIQRKRLETEISQVSTWERQRFGRELHDELGQELTGLGYLAQCLRQDLRKRGDTEEETARKLAEGLQLSIGKTRLIAQGQALAQIEAKDFVPSVEAVASLARDRWGVPCRVSSRKRNPIANDSDANQLLRIAQEAIYNAAKHAHASKIDVSIREKHNRVIVQVRDDGVGMPEPGSAGQGLGIHIMRHRANAICAIFGLQSSAKGGTVVTCSLSLRRHNDPSQDSHAADHCHAGQAVPAKL